MASMSYCRFENTATDFSACLNDLEKAIDEGMSESDFLSQLSSDYERRSYQHLVDMAAELLELVDQLRDVTERGSLIRAR